MRRRLSFNEPEGFLDYWDGFPQVYFDDQESWVKARTVEPNRATEDGLVVDPDWSLADSPHLFMPVPDNPNQFQAIHLRMLEQVVVPVARPEYKSVKLIQFFSEKDSGASARAAFEAEYVQLAAQMPGLFGATLNYRDSDQEAAMRGFFADDDWVFGEEGTALRREFCAHWTGAIELHFASIDAFVSARSAPQFRNSLFNLEREFHPRVLAR